MNQKEIAELTDEIMDDLHAWSADIGNSRKDRNEVWAGIKNDLTRILRNALGAKNEKV